jgi:hypothetical protein
MNSIQPALELVTLQLELEPVCSQSVLKPAVHTVCSQVLEPDRPITSQYWNLTANHEPVLEPAPVLK